MPNNHAAVYNLSTDGAFRVRFAAALCAYLPGVFAEVATAPDNTARRLTATKVLNAPQSYADKLALGAAAALTTAAGRSLTAELVTDAMLDALVVQYFTVLALAPPVP